MKAGNYWGEFAGASITRCFAKRFMDFLGVLKLVAGSLLWGGIKTDTGKMSTALAIYSSSVLY
jgi:hypothetical protein